MRQIQKCRTLAIALAWTLAACSPRPEGGGAVQIRPDAHNLFRGTEFYVEPSIGHVAALWVEQPEPARTEVAKWVDGAGTRLVVVVVHGKVFDHACAMPDADAYRTQMVESVGASIATRDAHRVVVILEPHLLTSLLAFPDTPECAAAAAAAQRLVASAISRLAQRGASVYLDGGSADLVRDAAARDRLAGIIKDIADHAGGTDKLRGFVIGVDGHASLDQQLDYMHHLEGALVKAGVLDKFFIIDRPEARTAPAPGVDAYFPVTR